MRAEIDKVSSGARERMKDGIGVNVMDGIRVNVKEEIMGWLVLHRRATASRDRAEAPPPSAQGEGCA